MGKSISEAAVVDVVPTNPDLVLLSCQRASIWGARLVNVEICVPNDVPL